jgi:hypothetical protein
MRLASSRKSSSIRRSNVSAAAGVISPPEKQVYRCEDSPDRSDKLAQECDINKIEKMFDGAIGCVSLLHGVRSE